MRAYRISGTNRITKPRITAQVAAITFLEAMKFMHKDYYRLSCHDKRGVEIESYV